MLSYEEWLEQQGGLPTWSEESRREAYSSYVTEYQSHGNGSTGAVGDAQYTYGPDGYLYRKAKVYKNTDRLGNPIYQDDWERTPYYNQDYDTRYQRDIEADNQKKMSQGLTYIADQQTEQNRLEWEREKFYGSQAAQLGQARQDQMWQQAQMANQQAMQQAMQQAQLQAQREERLAALAAQPKSWIEYAILSKTQPVVQPWMSKMGGGQTGTPIPGLMPEPKLTGSDLAAYNYNMGTHKDFAINPATGESQQIDAPNWTGEGDPSEGARANYQAWTRDQLAPKIDLLNPSAQLMSRMSPSEQAQYYGYQQWRTARSAQDEEARLWNMSAPTGKNAGLRWSR